MAVPKKTQKGKNKLPSKQMKLFRYNFYGSEAPKASNSMAMLDANKESARREPVVGREDWSMGEKVDQVLAMLSSVKDEVATVKTDFTMKLDNVKAAIRDLKKKLGGCNESVSQAEHCISGTEDKFGLQAKVCTLQCRLKCALCKLKTRIWMTDFWTWRPGCM